MACDQPLWSLKGILSFGKDLESKFKKKTFQFKVLKHFNYGSKASWALIFLKQSQKDAYVDSDLTYTWYSEDTSLKKFRNFAQGNYNNFHQQVTVCRSFYQLSVHVFITRMIMMGPSKSIERSKMGRLHMPGYKITHTFLFIAWLNMVAPKVVLVPRIDY